MRHDTRGVSTVISHILSLGVVAILIVGLISGVGGFLDGKQSTARAEQLDIVGGRLASDISTADRLATDGSTVVIDSSAPREVANGQYAAHLVGGPDPDEATLYINASGTGASSTIRLRTDTPICEGHASGGSMSVVVEDGCLTIEG